MELRQKVSVDIHGSPFFLFFKCLLGFYEFAWIPLLCRQTQFELDPIPASLSELHRIKCKKLLETR